MASPCLVATPLIALCVGYLPSSGEAVTVKKTCIEKFAQSTRDAAKACANTHEVRWRIKRDPVKWRK